MPPPMQRLLALSPGSRFRVNPYRASASAAAALRPRERLLVALGALGERVHGVVERREVEVRRHLLRLRRDERLAGVRRRREDALLDLAVPLARLLLPALEQLLQLARVAA